MSTRVVDRVDDWDQRTFSGGHGELGALADGEFSGVVRAEGAELFMTSGTVVGIRRGSIDDFADASGTVYEAPYPALPLLAIMQERSDEVRAQYYTEETPLSEVDGTLEDGGFTGYVELAENVLSGDYYQVYHGGHSMSAAYVGEAQRLLTGDEAFETADDEVGIYEVKPVEVEAIEIPEPADDGGATDDGGTAPGGGAAGGAAAGTGAEESVDEEEEADGAAEPADTSPSTDDGGAVESTGGSTDDGVDVPEAESDDDPSGGGAAAGTTTGDATAGATTAGSSTSGSESGDSAGSAASIPDAESDRGGSSASGSAGSGSSETGRSSGGGSSAGASRGQTQSTGSRQDASRGGTGGGNGAGGSTGGAGETAASSRKPARSASGDGSHLETRSIPSLDPERTRTRQRSSQSSGSQRGDSLGRSQRTGAAEGAGGQAAAESAPAEPSRGPEPEPEDEAAEPVEETGATSNAESASGEAVPADVESELASKEAEIERLEAELAEASGGHEDLEADLEAVREERDELQEEVDSLETELQRLEEEFGAATDTDQRLTAQEALSGTDIFVRYHSKGDATLAKAHEGSVRREDVTDNLRLEKHTQFDAESVAVGGQAYDEFLERTVEYQFVKWVVEHLLFEIRDTGHGDALQTLYDALPKVDRAELNGVVNVVITEDGQETRTQEGFDVVLRDRMGNPLLVANLNDSREAATEGMMEGLITSAERVGQSSETLACAFLVTRSFFEPEALETASEATQGGLLSRDKRRSFVNLSRKRGYHLCLVEARNENFHLAVPEL